MHLIAEQPGRGGSMTVDDVKARCAAIGLRQGRPGHVFAHEVIAGLSPEERGDVLVSTADHVTSLGRYCSDPAAPEYWPYLCHSACLRGHVVVPPGRVSALLTLLVDGEDSLKDYTGRQVGALLTLIRKAIADGGFLTSADIARLTELGVKLRELAGTAHRDKAKKKELVKRAEAVERLGGIEVSATALLMDRCDGGENPLALPDAPPANLAFWCGLLAAFAEGLHEIRDALNAARKPAWLADPARFAEAWPAAGPASPRHGAWHEGDAKLRDFAALRGMAKRRGRSHQLLVDPDAIRRLPELRALYAPTFRWRWNTSHIPALEQLADLERPGWTELLEHLITARMAPRPTASWRKQAVGLADAVGRAEVRARLSAWLRLFYAPPLDAGSLADRTNVEAMDHQAAMLDEALPDWPETIAPEEIAAVGRALAMAVASGAGGHLPPVFRPEFLECDDHLYDGRTASRGQLRLKHRRWRDMPVDWLHVSLENEALLRGAIWLAAEIMESAEAIAMLEAVAQAAAAKLHLSDDSHRSKVLANAAIATLIDRSGPEADAAVYRLTQAIPSRTINAPLFKALNRSSEAQPIST